MTPRASLFSLVALLVFVSSARAEDPFSNLHRALNDAADAALVRTQSVAQERPLLAPELPKTEPNQGTEPPLIFKEPPLSSGALKRINEVRPLLISILREEGVPDFLMAIVLVESRARNEAYSVRGAAGLWQLMPATARDYGLVVSGERDDRYNVPLATRAAARHLRRLFLVFGDWELVLAAYNFGEGRLQRKLASSGTFGKMITEGKLPEETSRYVPAVFKAAQTLQLSLK